MPMPVPGDQCRDVIGEAREFARALQHDYVGTEHLLIAMLRIQCNASRILSVLLDGKDAEHVRSVLVELVEPGKTEVTGEQYLTPLAKRTIELALRAALERGSEFIHTEDLLLGLARSHQAATALRILDLCGLDRHQLETKVKDCIERSKAASTEE